MGDVNSAFAVEKQAYSVTGLEIDQFFETLGMQRKPSGWSCIYSS